MEDGRLLLMQWGEQWRDGQGGVDRCQCRCLHGSQEAEQGIFAGDGRPHRHQRDVRRVVLESDAAPRESSDGHTEGPHRHEASGRARARRGDVAHGGIFARVEEDGCPRLEWAALQRDVRLENYREGDRWPGTPKCRS